MTFNTNIKRHDQCPNPLHSINYWFTNHLYWADEEVYWLKNNKNWVTFMPLLSMIRTSFVWLFTINTLLGLFQGLSMVMRVKILDPVCRVAIFVFFWSALSRFVKFQKTKFKVVEVGRLNWSFVTQHILKVHVQVFVRFVYCFTLRSLVQKSNFKYWAKWLHWISY